MFALILPANPRNDGPHRAEGALPPRGSAWKALRALYRPRACAHGLAQVYAVCRAAAPRHESLRRVHPLADRIGTLALFLSVEHAMILAIHIAWMCVSYAAFRCRNMADAYFLAARFITGFVFAMALYADVYAHNRLRPPRYVGDMSINLEWLVVTFLYYRRRDPLFSPGCADPAQV